MVAINYIIRSLVLLVGIVLVSGALNPPDSDNTMYTVLGIVVILFAIYRLISYHTALKRYNFVKKGDNEDEED